MYDYSVTKTQTKKHNKTIPILIFLVSLYPLYYFIAVEIPKYKRSETDSFFDYLMNDFAGRMLLPILFLGAFIYLIYALTRKNKIIERIYNFKFFKKDDNFHCTIKMEEFETTKDGCKHSNEKTTDHLLITSISKVKEIIEKRVTYNNTSTRTGMNLNHITGKKDMNLDNPVGVYKTRSKGSYIEKRAIYKNGDQKVISTNIPLEILQSAAEKLQ